MHSSPDLPTHACPPNARSEFGKCPPPQSSALEFEFRKLAPLYAMNPITAAIATSPKFATAEPRRWRFTCACAAAKPPVPSSITWKYL